MNRDLVNPKSKVEIRTNHKIPNNRKYKGIIISNTDDELMLLTEEGQTVEINLSDIIYIKKATFDRNVSDSLNKLIKVHEKLIEVLDTIKYLEELKIKYEDTLFDAHLLSEFSTHGAVRNIQDSFIRSDYWKGQPKKSNEKASFVFDISENDGLILLECFISKYIELNISESVSKADFDRLSEEVKKENIRNLSDKTKMLFPNSIRIDFKEEHIKHLSYKGYLLEAKYLIPYSISSENFKERKKEIINGINDFLKILD